MNIHHIIGIAIMVGVFEASVLFAFWMDATNSRKDIWQGTLCVNAIVLVMIGFISIMAFSVGQISHP